MADYYNILGVSQTATQEQIKQAYRQLQLKHHPDKGGNSSSHTASLINSAYEVLGNVEKRRYYDNIGCSALISTGIKTKQSPTPIPIFIKITVDIATIWQDNCAPITIKRWYCYDDGEKVWEEETMYITIPQGIDNNEMIIVREKGNVLNDVKGDVKITVCIENTTEFKRDGLNLILPHTISLKDALCGCKIEFTHLNKRRYILDTTDIIVAPNSKQTFAGMGIIRGSFTGTLTIEFTVVFPSSLTAEQIATVQSIL